MQTTLVCTECDEAFTAEYTPYSQQKAVDCPTCGERMDLPQNSGQSPQISAPEEAIRAPLSKVHWSVASRYLLSGVICAVTGLAFTVWSVSSFTIYVPLLLLALVFGVLDVVDRRPLRGLGVIMFTVLVGALVHGSSMEREFGESLRQMSRELESLQNTLGI